MNKDIKKNASGYDDPTAYNAITHADRDTNKRDIRFYKLLHTIFHVCELAGFELQGRIALKDVRSGKIYK